MLGLGSLQGGVAGVGFSALNKGAYVVAVDSSKDKVLHAVYSCTGVTVSYLLPQVLHMWDWAGPDLLSKVTLDTAAISGVAFHPFDNNLVITHGRGHLAFWNRWMCRYLLNIYTISTHYLYNINASQEEGRVLLPG